MRGSLGKAVRPYSATKHSAGYDLYSAENKEIMTRSCEIINTDVSIKVPRDTYGRIAPHSGLTVKHLIDIGTDVTDSDYRGNVGIVLFNHSSKIFRVEMGDRISQLILKKISHKMEEVEEFSDTERGAEDFGSTGKNKISRRQR